MADQPRTTTIDPVKWLDAMALQVGEEMFRDVADELRAARKAADELRAARDALREIEERAGFDRGAEWCRERARSFRLGR